MRALFFVFLFVFCTAGAGIAGGKTVTYYLDGAKVEYETTFGNGYSEIQLPKGAYTDSLRIKPLGGAEIERVKIERAKTDPKAEREIISLAERKKRLVDGLKVLETREEIFKAAAKSQSSRAPRKTKNNPEPLTNIRRGTEFAMGQLESVYASRRRTEKEIALLDSKLSSMKAAKGSEGYLCRVWLSAKRGRVHISYVTAEQNWKPSYDFRLLGDGRVEVIMRAVFPIPDKNSSVKVLQAKISDAGSHLVPPRTLSKPFGKICEYTFPVENEVLSDGAVNTVTFNFKNLSDRFLPDGDAACFRRGEFIGQGPFKGMMPLESRTLSFGLQAGR